MNKERDKRYILLTILQFLLLIFLKPLFRFFLHLKVTGLENIPSKKTSLVIASNHISELDALLLGAALPFLSGTFPLFFIAKSTEGYKNFGFRGIFYGGALFRLVGAYQIYSGTKNYAHSLQNHTTLLDEGETVVIFPEGSRSADGLLQKARGGVAFLAHNKETAVLPVSISGLFGITLSDFFFRKRFITISFGEPLKTRDLFKTEDSFLYPDYEKEAQFVMKHIQKLL